MGLFSPSFIFTRRPSNMYLIRSLFIGSSGCYELAKFAVDFGLGSRETAEGVYFCEGQMMETEPCSPGFGSKNWRGFFLQGHYLPPFCAITFQFRPTV